MSHVADEADHISPPDSNHLRVQEVRLPNTLEFDARKLDEITKYALTSAWSQTHLRVFSGFTTRPKSTALGVGGNEQPDLWIFQILAN
jgi:hypothetical protein